MCVCVCASFAIGVEGGAFDLIVLIPDHCLSIYLIAAEQVCYALPVLN